jgi:hypothetical protein
VTATDAERLAAGARFVKARLIEAGLVEGTEPCLSFGHVFPGGDVGFATNVYASAADIDALIESERAALGDTTATYGTVVVDDPDAGGGP